MSISQGIIQNTRFARIQRAGEEVTSARLWIQACGTNLEGYVANYGSVDDPEHYGDGGEAIYAADRSALIAAIERYEALRTF